VHTNLLVGIGNLDRQDDGVAWHVLSRLALKLGQTIDLENVCETISLSQNIMNESDGPIVEYLFTLQLTPEQVDIVSAFDRVCFVDAHTGKIPDDIQFSALNPHYQSSPFTHHMTPETLLALTQALYNKIPISVLISIRGFEFGFSSQLTPATNRLADQAVDIVLDWLNGK
jgi:Ni,Fe-hydrogenase maturation factor